MINVDVAPTGQLVLRQGSIILAELSAAESARLSVLILAVQAGIVQPAAQPTTPPLKLAD